MLRAALATVVSIALFAALLFGAAGRWDWPMAWAFVAVYTAFCIAAFVALPAPLIVERSRLMAGGTRSDIALAIGFFSLLYLATFVTCGLDARFAWSPPLPAWLSWGALGVFAAGYGFAFAAMRANPFFATVVRVQRERGHRVVDSGPYAVVRHPGYAGAMVAHLAVPIALGSLWALIPAALGSLLLAMRVLNEERTLVGGLDGYAAYRTRVRWRLLPGVW
jgi:protein-S-isoprenylcysteine O-methyltransferase Ste14